MNLESNHNQEPRSLKQCSKKKMVLVYTNSTGHADQLKPFKMCSIIWRANPVTSCFRWCLEEASLTPPWVCEHGKERQEWLRHWAGWQCVRGSEKRAGSSAAAGFLQRKNSYLQIITPNMTIFPGPSISPPAWGGLRLQADVELVPGT